MKRKFEKTLKLISNGNYAKIGFLNLNDRLKMVGIMINKCVIWLMDQQEIFVAHYIIVPRSSKMRGIEYKYATLNANFRNNK